MTGSKYLTKAIELYPKVMRERDSEYINNTHKVVVTEKDLPNQGTRKY